MWWECLRTLMALVRTCVACDDRLSRCCQEQYYSFSKEVFCIWSWAIHGIKSIFAKSLCLEHPGEAKTFFPARRHGSNQPDNFSLQDDNVWTKSNTTNTILEAFHALETPWAVFWAPQHLVPVNSLSCRREEGWSPTHAVNCRAPKSARSPGWALGAPAEHDWATWELQTLSACPALWQPY